VDKKEVHAVVWVMHENRGPKKSTRAALSLWRRCSENSAIPRRLSDRVRIRIRTRIRTHHRNARPLRWAPSSLSPPTYWCKSCDFWAPNTPPDSASSASRGDPLSLTTTSGCISSTPITLTRRSSPKPLLAPVTLFRTLLN